MTEPSANAALLKSAFIDASLQIAYEQIESVKEAVEPSAKHQKKMQKLMKQSDRFYWRAVNSPKKRLVLLLTALLLLLLAGCTVYVQVIKPQLKLQSGTFSGWGGTQPYILFGLEDEVPEGQYPATIQKEQTFTALPDGYVIKEKSYRSKKNVTTKWTTADGREIRLSQSTLDLSNIAVDRGDATVFTVELENGDSVTCWRSNGKASVSAMWISGDYFYSLDASDLSDAELQVLLNSLK